MTWDTLVLATTNAGKIREFRQSLGSYTLLSAADAGATDFPDETGGSYAANALTKASYVLNACGLPCLADDSGLEVDALEGEPGLYSARFGERQTDAARIDYLLERLGEVPEEARTARFVCVLALVTPDGEAKTFEGQCKGRITARAAGTNGHGYDPVFYSFDLAKTFGEADDAEKAAVSHRARALSALATYLRETP